MKKWFACIMCFVMMLGLVACGEDANVEIPDEVSGKNDSSAEYVINLASTSLPGQAPTMAEEDFIAEVEEKVAADLSLSFTTPPPWALMRIFFSR